MNRVSSSLNKHWPISNAHIVQGERILEGAKPHEWTRFRL